MAASASTATQVAGDGEAGKELVQLFERLIELPPLLIIVLRPLPGVELARIARIHKAFWRVLLILREQQPGPRYSAPTAEEKLKALGWNRMVRAGYYGDVVVLQAMVTAGVDEHGTPLHESVYCSAQPASPFHRTESRKTLDKALSEAVGGGHIDAAQLLHNAGANVDAVISDALTKALRNEPKLAFLRSHGGELFRERIERRIRTDAVLEDIRQGAATWAPRRRPQLRWQLPMQRRAGVSPGNIPPNPPPNA